jgi:hypothetical protein
MPDHLAHNIFTSRATLAFAITDATGSLGQEIDVNTIESQNMERSRNSIGETIRIRVKRRLIETTMQTLDKAQLDFPPVAHYSSMIPACLCNDFYTIE